MSGRRLAPGHTSPGSCPLCRLPRVELHEVQRGPGASRLQCSACAAIHVGPRLDKSQLRAQLEIAGTR
jgi:hypothetical protein